MADEIIDVAARLMRDEVVSQHLSGCAIALALETSAMAMAHYCCLTGQRWHRDVGGFPCYASIFSLLHQGVIFPSLLIIALAPVIAGTLTWHDWLHNGWDDAPLACALFHYTILGYWCKDVVVPLSALMWVHHAACVGGVVASLTGALPRCAAMYTLGAVTLELGSLANAVHELRPDIGLAGARDRRLRAACTALMWASNLLAVYWVLLYATTFTETAVERDGVVGRWSAAVVGCGLAAVRQRDLLKRNADEDDAASNGARALV